MKVTDVKFSEHIHSCKMRVNMIPLILKGTFPNVMYMFIIPIDKKCIPLVAVMLVQNILEILVKF